MQNYKKMCNIKTISTDIYGKNMEIKNKKSLPFFWWGSDLYG